MNKTPMPRLSGCRSMGAILIESWLRFPFAVPDELIELSQTYGGGMYARDYRRFIDPYYAWDALRGALPNETLVPFVFTGMGDVVAWDPRSRRYFLFLYRIGEVASVTDEFSFVINGFEENADAYQAEDFEWSPFQIPVKRLGIPRLTDCFAYEPSPLAGGSGKIDAVKSVAVPENTTFLYQASPIQNYFYSLRDRIDGYVRRHRLSIWPECPISCVFTSVRLLRKWHVLMMGSARGGRSLCGCAACCERSVSFRCGLMQHRRICRGATWPTTGANRTLQIAQRVWGNIARCSRVPVRIQHVSLRRVNRREEVMSPRRVKSEG